MKTFNQYINESFENRKSDHDVFRAIEEGFWRLEVNHPEFTEQLKEVMKSFDVIRRQISQKNLQGAPENF